MAYTEDLKSSDESHEGSNPSAPTKKLYQIDSGYACAGVVTVNNIIVESAPIFRKLIGQDIRRVKYKKILVWEEK